MKIGTKVLIVDNLSELKDNGDDIALDMLEYAGKEAIITDIYLEGASFELDIDEGYWSWYPNLINKIG